MNCKDCRWWHPTGFTEAYNLAECHRHAPILLAVVPSGLREHTPHWPETYGINGCGDFEPKLAGEGA